VKKIVTPPTLDEQVRILRVALTDIRDEAAERADVVDGPDGQPRPNAWMSIQVMADEALAKAEGKAPW
jgi:hypothetical protein